MENNNTAKTTKSPEQNFEELYVKKEYKEAINKLLQNKQQFSSGTFHYNLGTTYAKLGDWGAARFHLEKAQNSGMYSQALQNNLSFVQSKIDTEDLSTSNQIVDQFMNYSLNIPAEGYVSMSLILILIFLVVARIKKITSRWVLITLFLLALIPTAFMRIYVAEINYAVAMKDISLYEGPSKIFQEKGKVKAGSKIILGEFKEGWFFIKYPISLAGWINKDNLGIY